jgi:hypothetical protein
MESGSPAFKVAIPRLKTCDRAGKSPQRKARVEKACDVCRKRKVRCSGEQPQCRNCVDLDEHCNYAQSRKDRLNEFVFRTLGICTSNLSRITVVQPITVLHLGLRLQAE